MSRSVPSESKMTAPGTWMGNKSMAVSSGPTSQRTPVRVGRTETVCPPSHGREPRLAEGRVRVRLARMVEQNLRLPWVRVEDFLARPRGRQSLQRARRSRRPGVSSTPCAPPISISASCSTSDPRAASSASPASGPCSSTPSLSACSAASHPDHRPHGGARRPHPLRLRPRLAHGRGAPLRVPLGDDQEWRTAGGRLHRLLGLVVSSLPPKAPRPRPGRGARRRSRRPSGTSRTRRSSTCCTWANRTSRCAGRSAASPAGTSPAAMGARSSASRSAARARATRCARWWDAPARSGARTRSPSSPTSSASAWRWRSSG